VSIIFGFTNVTMLVCNDGKDNDNDVKSCIDVLLCSWLQSKS